jgi:protein ImuB
MTQTATTSKRAMFVWLPNFAMTLARAKRPPLAKPHEPLALLEKHGNIRRIAALDEPAIRAGLYLHQPLADALAVYPKLVSADAEPEATQEALTVLAVWTQRYTPATAPAPPSGLWLDITGCAHLWGGEAELAEDLLARLEARGVPARAAIAPTFGAAYALAHHATRYVISSELIQEIKSTPHPVLLPQGEKERLRNRRGLPPLPTASAPGCGLDELRTRQGEFDRERAGVRGSYSDIPALLAPLPVERLRIGAETASALRKLGLFTIGDVQKLPRAGLSRRFPDLLPQLDKAMGLAAEAIEFLRPPTPWIERLRFAEPISAPEDLERVTIKLLDMLCARLQAKRQGGQRFEAIFFRSDGGVQSQTVSTALPVRDAARIFRLFREKLGLIDPGFGIDAAMLAASHVEPLEARQANILRKVQSTACLEELAVLIEALENRLGEGRAYRLAPCESYIPERAVKRAAAIPETPKALSGIAKSRARSPRKDLGYRQAGSGMTLEAERPIRLFAQPQPIDVTAAIPDAPPMLFRWRKVVHRVVRADGPERISPEWWRGAGDTEEEGQVRDYYCVESVHGMRFWVFREGLYGGDRLPRWYLHGVFA